MSNLKNNIFLILSVILSLFSLILLSLGLFELQRVGDFNAFSMDYFISGLVCLSLSFYLSYQHRKIMKLRLLGRHLTITVVKCSNPSCNFKEEREFKVGDYIFKRIGQCPKCNGDLYIYSIYAQPLKK
ncbi:MAG: hypothetical protein NDF53_01250 [archaeon GB-1867-097]|nr:hypothetical protein [Candidatus Culexmicrobium thermophilum]MCS7384348.1 hypothetical protein [Candidatus Culexmicrobium thermophilum]